MTFFTQCYIVMRREAVQYMANPLALIFIGVFLVMTSAFTFHLGNFFDRNQADMLSLFRFLPWICIVFAPALAMRHWSEDIANGTLELLLTLPISPPALLLGKFLTLWLVGIAAIGLSFPLWLVITYLGNPDHTMVLTGYLGAFLLIGTYLAITATISIFTANQLSALIPGVALCFLFTISGAKLTLAYLTDWLPQSLISAIANLSLLVHYENFTRGVIDFRSLFFFLGIILLCLMIMRLGLRRLQIRS